MKYKHVKHCTQCGATVSTTTAKTPFMCRSCSQQSRRRTQMSQVSLKELLMNHNKLLVGEDTYNGNTQKVDFICMLHPDKVQTAAVYTIKQGRGCSLCSGQLKATAKRLSPEEVYQRLRPTKYIPMFTFDEYLSSKDKLPYVCSLHQQEGLQFANLINLTREEACRFCKRDKMSGSNHFGWKGGAHSLKEYVRHHIYKWKSASMRSCSYSCVIEKGRFNHIHHLYPIDDILADSLVSLGLRRDIKFNDLSEQELMQVESEVLSQHFKHPLGVCLTTAMHNEFHQTFGRRQNTVEQFKEFYYSKTGGTFIPQYFQGEVQ